MRGAIVLAGGKSRRIGGEKALARVGGIPLVLRVVEAAAEVVDEVVVVSRGPSARAIESILPEGIFAARDARRERTPLAGLLTGGSRLRSPYVAALACDLPFLRPAVLARLFAEARGHDAAVPRWPDGFVEPLVAVYRREALISAVPTALNAGARSNQEMLERIHDVRWLDVEPLRDVDPDLRSFLNVNTDVDLARARRLARVTRPVGGPRRR